MTLSLLSTCSWCVVRAYTWLSLWLSLSSPPVAGVWCVHTLDCLYVSLSSPPVAGVWWAHWRRCPVAAVASSKWMLHTGGGWGETPHMIVKHVGCTAIHNKALYKSIIHSFIHMYMWRWHTRSSQPPWVGPFAESCICGGQERLDRSAGIWNQLPVGTQKTFTVRSEEKHVLLTCTLPVVGGYESCF